MTHIIKASLVAMLLIGLTIGIVYAFTKGMERDEIYRCRTLMEQAADYAPHFFLASWEDEMCRAHGIIINAPVK